MTSESYEKEKNLSSGSLNQVTERSHADQMPLPLRSSISASSENEAETAPRQEYTTTQSKSKLHLNPGFSLVQDGEARFPNPVERQKMLDLFPSCSSLSIQPPLIIVCFETLPQKPWPVTLGGLALYFTTEPHAHPLHKGLGGHGPGLKVAAEIHRTRSHQHEAFIEVFAALDKLNIKVTKIQWIAGRFHALVGVQPENEWQSRFPATINDVLINYSFGEETIPHNQGCLDNALRAASDLEA